MFILINAIEEIMEKNVKNEEERHKHFVHIFSESVKNILEENKYIMEKWKSM